MAEDKDKKNPADLDGDGTVTDKEQKQYDKDQKEERKDSADRLEAAFLKSEFAWAYRLIKSNDELWQLWNKAVDERWEVSRFILKFRDSDYYQRKSESWLKVEALKQTKPKAYRDELRVAAAKIRDDAVRIGARVSESRALELADKYLRLGFNDPESSSAYQNWLGSRVRVQGEQGFTGAAGQTEQAIMASLNANGINPSNDKWAQWMRGQVKKISVGDTTIEDSVDYIRRQAASRYQAFGEEMIATGRDLSYYATPYLAAMQDTLELPDSEVNLQDSYIKEALEGYQDDSGKWKQMSVSEFEKKLRQDSRWRTTKNANDKGERLLNTILRRFGVNA